jgi:hypothetical protein
VDHQVQNNVDIEAPGRELRQPVNFEELGPGCGFARHSDDRIEPLDVSHLKDTLIHGRRID